MNLRIYFLSIFFSVSGALTINAQVNGNPSINLGPNLTIPCNQQCVDVTADLLEAGLTTDYGVQSIPHAPPLPYNAQGGNNVSTANDDSWSNVIQLPFPFCFYGDTYTELKIGANGALKLGPTPLTNGGNHPWSFNASVPSPNLVNAGNIYGVYHDLSPSLFQGVIPGLLMGSINWFVEGTAPNRQFIVIYNNTPHFACLNINTTSQIVLYENSNIIDVFVNNKPRCNIWNGGRAVIGIQNNTGTAGITPPGRNTGSYNISSPEAWRFVPDGPSAYSTVEWFEGGNQIGTGTTLNICPSPSNTYTARTTFTTCTGQNVVLEDNITVSFEVVNVSVSPINSFICAGQTTTLTATSPQATDYVWNPGGLTGASVDVTPNSTTSYTVTATNANNGCTAEATANITLAQPQENVCNVLYVSPVGVSSAPGTRAAPLDLETAMDIGGCIGTTIKMAIGDYVTDTTIIAVTNFLTLEGGFDPNNNWEKVSTPGATRILRTANNVTDPTGPSPRLIGIEVVGQTGFRFQDITVEVEDAPNADLDNNGVSTYGIYLNACSDYKIVRTQILAGDAGNGGNGSIGQAGTPGPNGGDACGRQGGAGGGNGGNGGAGGTATGCSPCVFGNCLGPCNGNVGQAGGGPNGGAGGTRGTGAGVTCPAFGFFSGSHGGNGGNGGNGTNGGNGGIGSGPNFDQYFEPGLPGANGVDGTIGGGGGGAGGSVAATSTAGGGGGGGGGGGAGGQGGLGGRAGGGSFALYIFDNGPGAQIIDIDMFNGDFGVGGVGGTGGQGGPGGQSGSSSTNPCSGCQNFNDGGGNGGTGGNGGVGGDAQDGLSVLFYVTGNLPEFITGGSTQLLVQGENTPTNFDLSAQPLIRMDDVACTETDMEFRGDFSATWTFDLGSNPTSASGQDVITEYNDLGRKDIEFDGNAYVGFANIILDAQLLPEFITSAPEVDGIPTVCAGEEVSFTATNAGVNYNFLWELGGGATPNEYQGLEFETITAVFDTPGEYEIQLQYETNCCGISFPGFMTIRVIESPVAIASEDQEYCFGTLSGVQLSVEGVTENGSIIWSPSTGLSNVNNDTVFALPSFSTTYTVTLTDSTGLCSSSDQVEVNVITLDFDVQTQPATCDVLGEAEVTVTGGSGNYEFEWENGETTNEIGGLQPGVYRLIVSDLDLGCIDSVYVEIEAGLETLSASATVINELCLNQGDGSIEINIVDGNTPYTIAWSGDTVLTFDNVVVLDQLTPGEYEITIIDDFGCLFDLSPTVEPADSIILIEDQAQDPTCLGINDGVIVVKADGGERPYTFEWNNDIPVVLENDDVVATNLPPNDYTLTIVDANGCIDSINISLTVDSVPTIVQDTTICAQDVVSLFGSDFVLTTDTVVSDSTFDADGCITNLVFVNIEVLPLPDVSVEANPDTIFIFETSTLEADGGDFYEWDFPSDGSAQVDVQPEETTTFEVTITNNQGCSFDTSVIVYVIDKEVPLKVPDAFTPNGDGINDVFRVVNPDRFRDISMKVYNRWGEKVHEGVDENHGWDGVFNGRDQPVGVYVYHITAISLVGENEYRLKGNVSLIR